MKFTARHDLMAPYVQVDGRRDGRGNGQGNGWHTKHWCTHCNLDSHTAKDCRKRKRAQSEDSTCRSTKEKTKKSRIRKEGNDERTCYQCGLPGHFKANYIHYKRVQEQGTKLRKPAGYGDLLYRARGHKPTTRVYDGLTVIS
jgi:hypothetical protein